MTLKGQTAELLPKTVRKDGMQSYIHVLFLKFYIKTYSSLMYMAQQINDTMVKNRIQRNGNLKLTLWKTSKSNIFLF